MDETRHAVIEYVILEKPPAGGKGAPWYILQTDIGRCTGEMGWKPRPGERLKLTGRDKLYAGVLQFAFRTAIPDVPEDAHALLTYICSRTHGVGDALRDQIWEACGRDWQSAIAQGKTDGIEGLGAQRLAAIRATLAEVELDKECAQACGRLMALGATEKLASKAWRRWELQTIAIVEANPYNLTQLDNVGFVQVDQSVALAMGITGTDPRRMGAGVQYALRLRNEQGDTLVTWSDLQAEACKCLGASPADVCAAVVAAFDAGYMVGFADVEGIASAAQVSAAETIMAYMEDK